MTLRYAADCLGVRRQDLAAMLRQMGWVNRDGYPYIGTRQDGLMITDVQHPGKDRHGNWLNIRVPKITGAGYHRISMELEGITDASGQKIRVTSTV